MTHYTNPATIIEAAANIALDYGKRLPDHHQGVVKKASEHIARDILAMPVPSPWLPIEQWTMHRNQLLLWEPVEGVPEGMVYVGSCATGEWTDEIGEVMNPVLFQRIQYPESPPS